LLLSSSRINLCILHYSKGDGEVIMRKTTLFLVILILPFVGSSAFADPVDPSLNVKFGDVPNRPNPGGPFFVLQPVGPGGAWEVIGLSMCVEKDEYIVLGAEYAVDSILQGATEGGIAGEDPAGGKYDPLSNEAAWVFYNFVTGHLYGGIAALSMSSAQYAEIQEAIWCAENEQACSTNNGTYVNPVLAAATAAVAGGWVNNGKVSVLNPISLDRTTQKQSQLVLTPEPSTLLLLGAGLFGFAAGSRVLRRKL